MHVEIILPDGDLFVSKSQTDVSASEAASLLEKHWGSCTCMTLESRHRDGVVLLPKKLLDTAVVWFIDD